MDMLRFLTASALVVLAMTVATAQTDYLARARALHKQSLLIDGHNDYPWALREHDAARSLDTLDISAVRRQLGVVLQNGKLATGSLYDNICGGVQLPLEHAWEAARLAGLDADIERLGTWLKAINIVLMPVLLTLAALGIVVMRRKRKARS